MDSNSETGWGNGGGGGGMGWGGYIPRESARQSGRKEVTSTGALRWTDCRGMYATFPECRVLGQGSDNKGCPGRKVQTGCSVTDLSIWVEIECPLQEIMVEKKRNNLPPPMSMKKGAILLAGDSGVRV